MPGSRRSARPGDERGLVFPSPVVVLSIVAVVMAAVAFVATRGSGPTEREVTVASDTSSTAAPAPTAAATASPATPAPVKLKPAVDRATTFVEVYNNSGIKGLAGGAAEQADAAGWQVVGSDNWYGTIPTTTVYYPKRLAAAAKQLALDLGVERTAPAVDPMRSDRLTLILTGPLG